jgi:hypothetical protein
MTQGAIAHDEVVFSSRQEPTMAPFVERMAGLTKWQTAMRRELR